MQSFPNEGELLGLFSQPLFRFKKTSHERLADREDRRNVRDDDGGRSGANIARNSERARGRNELQSLVFSNPLPCDNAWVRFAFFLNRNRLHVHTNAAKDTNPTPSNPRGTLAEIPETQPRKNTTSLSHESPNYQKGKTTP